ncbi:nucleoside recognition domain-containing protein [Clostridiisalibacter paucivorans]|uniref:nucleoside recognition domain-containing protein n=1 Tax=Clostridiisalibacter paucivorans TaxID=408753 RepID=UPI000479B376|nr:nucleoside recognition domain-containing protein [Clostridiisalibacter paucivorans]
MINVIWLLMIVVGVVVGAINGNLEAVTQAAMDSANLGVELSLGLIGIMALWLGIMKIAEDSGMIQGLAKLLKPIMVRLFPDVPPDHPAMGAIIMNMAANVLGLGNAATPLGLKAMQELQELNDEKDTATNAMCTFLAINTSSVTLIPSEAMALLVAVGATSKQATAIIGPSIIATAVSTIVAVIAVKSLQRLKVFKMDKKSTKKVINN